MRASRAISRRGFLPPRYADDGGAMRKRAHKAYHGPDRGVAEHFSRNARDHGWRSLQRSAALTVAETACRAAGRAARGSRRDPDLDRCAGSEKPAYAGAASQSPGFDRRRTARKPRMEARRGHAVDLNGFSMCTPA
jgi:hypothetical protein